MSALLGALQAFDTSGLSARARPSYALRPGSADGGPPREVGAGSGAPDKAAGSLRAGSVSRGADRVTISAEAREASQGSSDIGAAKSADGQPLSESEQKQVEELKARDREVRRHEQAHKSAAGQYATSGPTYTYQTGPDGKRYAVGGQVGIDVSPEGTPEETIRKMEVVRRAALAPAEPSAQDRKVAAQAQRTAQEARQELQQQRAEERSGQSESDAAGGGLSAVRGDARASGEGAEGEAPVVGLSGEVGGSATPGGDDSGAEGVEIGLGGGGSADGAPTATLGGDTPGSSPEASTGLSGSGSAGGALAGELISQLTQLAEPDRRIDLVA